MKQYQTCLVFVCLCPCQRHTGLFWCRPNNPSLWQTKQSAGQPGSIALPLAHCCTFLTQLGFHSYLWGRGRVGGNNLWFYPSWNNEWLVYTHANTHPPRAQTSIKTFSAFFHLDLSETQLSDNRYQYFSGRISWFYFTRLLTLDSFVSYAPMFYYCVYCLFSFGL